MEKMQHTEELVREFLVFHGFTNTLESYEAELRTDIGKGFEVDKILDLIFSLLRFCNHNDKVVDFFTLYGVELLQRSQDWTNWFVIPYKKNPHLDLEFRVFFSKEWYQAFHLSSRNFFCKVFNATHILHRV
ncbi:WD repeat-containing protein 91 [Glycine soja]|nr:WD repeat-containing protein 91 [Glycine soja]